MSSHWNIKKGGSTKLHDFFLSTNLILLQKRGVPVPLKYLLLVVLFIIFLPISGATIKYFSFYSVRFYEVMFVGFLTVAPLLLVNKQYGKVLFVFLVIMVGIILHSIAHGQSVFNTINSIRDVLWYLIGILIGMSLFNKCTYYNILRLYWLLLGVYCVYLLLAYTIAAPLLIQFSEDAHGFRSDGYLRVGFVSVSLLMWLFIYLFSYARMYQKLGLMFVYAATMLVPVLCTGSRSMLGAYLLVILWVLVKRFYVGVMLFFAAVLLALTFGFFDGRFSAEGIVISWVSRNMPFVEAVLQFDMVDWLQGRGFGQMFEIPWFEHTVFDTRARNVDGLYQTLLVKVGVIGTLFFVAWNIYLKFSLTKIQSGLAFSLGVIIVIQLLFGLTNTFLFQLSAVFYGLPIGVTLELLRRYKAFKVNIQGIRSDGK